MAQSDDIKQLQGDVQSIKDELSEVLASIKKTLSQAETSQEGTSLNPMDLFHTLQEKIQVSKEEGEKIFEDAQDYIAKNPIKSLAGAALVGYMLAKITSLGK